MDDKTSDNTDNEAATPVRGVPVMDIQAPRTSFAPKQPEEINGVNINPVVQNAEQDTARPPAVGSEYSPTDDTASVTPVEPEVEQDASEGQQPSEFTEQTAQVQTNPSDGDDSASSAPVENAAPAPENPPQQEAQVEEIPVPTTSEQTDQPHIIAQKKSPALLIFVAIVIALLLSGIAIYVFLQSQDSESRDATTGTSQQQTELNATQPTGPVDQSELDATSSQVDEAISEVDNADLSDDSLSDSALGL